jgi:hypothetical protein
MSGATFHETLLPWQTADFATVTLAGTNKALYTPGNFPILGGHFFGFIGKKIHIRLFGKITTAATPGNLSFGIYYGDGTDANGVLLASSAAFALTANQTNISWELDVYVKCLTPGATGTLLATGMFNANVSVVASTLQPVMIPASAAAASAACDLSASKIISIQALRSGSTVETMTVQDFDPIATN